MTRLIRMRSHGKKMITILYAKATFKSFLAFAMTLIRTNLCVHHSYISLLSHFFISIHNPLTNQTHILEGTAAPVKRSA